MPLVIAVRRAAPMMVMVAWPGVVTDGLPLTYARFRRAAVAAGGFHTVPFQVNTTFSPAPTPALEPPPAPPMMKPAVPMLLTVNAVFCPAFVGDGIVSVCPAVV